MGLWEVRALDDLVMVDAPHWLAAVALGAPRMGLHLDPRARLMAEVRGSGVVRVRDPVSGHRLLLRMMPMADALAGEDDLGADDLATAEVDAFGPRPLPVPQAPSMPTLVPLSDDLVTLNGDDDLPETDEPTEAVPKALARPIDEALATVLDVGPDEHAEPESSASPPPPPKPVLAPPTPLGADLEPLPAASAFDAEDLQTLHDPAELEDDPEASSDLLEALFLEGAAVTGAQTVEEAASAVLEILRRHVGAFSGVVLYAGLDDPGLRIIGAYGARMNGRLGEITPFGVGIAGYVFDSGRSVMVQQGLGAPTATLQEHTASWTGALAVPVRDDAGNTYGVVELIDPSFADGEFMSWHLEAAEMVAMTLAQHLLARSG
jgi:hypothetical protein